MPRLGRRAGGRDTRSEIVSAARVCFAECGYEGTSLRHVARRAGVDAALVHHYFAGKAELFLAVTDIGRDPADILREVQASPEPARALALAFLRTWEGTAGEPGRPLFATVLQAVASSPAVASAFREFLTERVWGRVESEDGQPGPGLRQAMVASQLWGMAVARYVLAVEPLASASTEQAAEWLAAMLDHSFEAPGRVAPEVGR